MLIVKFSQQHLHWKEIIKCIIKYICIRYTNDLMELVINRARVPEDEDHFIQKSTWPATKYKRYEKDQETGKLVPGASRTLFGKVEG